MSNQPSLDDEIDFLLNCQYYKSSQIQTWFSLNNGIFYFNARKTNFSLLINEQMSIPRMLNEYSQLLYNAMF